MQNSVCQPAHWIIGSDSTSDVPWLEKNRESRSWRMQNIFNSISKLKRVTKIWRQVL
ncbi:hypothetical protein POPTR_014G003501v4 [Populus trichocarpa]|uniref:Uncharacterized protein n=2 Tax=Populus trichocarpa TaxID=3694 RepID=A0ACC0RXK8_POPTR|nr:hypothetical protein POPTR_014G003501v4 [Populus trichocarpa]KAI9381677.1 hypothetical protein POPTR_014G003501v4 [Populus trichocarpa]